MSLVDMPATDFAVMGYDDICRLAHEPTAWLWQGYLARESVTLLTSRWKTGKTTLLSVLLARMATGGDLAGLEVAAGRAVVVSEESPAMWADRGRRLGFGPHLRFMCRPFRGKPSPAQWEALIDRLTAERAAGRLDLAVIDPLASFLPGPDENHASTVLAALAPLQRLAAAGAAVLLLHHPRKLDGEPRGSGALTGFADVLMTMVGAPAGQADDRRRRLRAASRFAETPGELCVALSPDGTDYEVAADAAAESFASGWPVVKMVLEDARRMLTRREVREQWPEDHPVPCVTVLWRWLDAATDAGLVVREGKGRRRKPFRYCLPGRVREFRDGLDDPDDPDDFEDLPPLEPLPPLDPLEPAASMAELAAEAREVLRRTEGYAAARTSRKRRVPRGGAGKA